MPLSLQAGLWGLLAGSALLLGAGATFLVTMPARWIAAIMAFGSGVLISALSFELMDEAFHAGGVVPTALGFLAGAAVYTAANIWISRRGGHCRKRSGHQQQQADEDSGLAIAVGALLDGIPESVVIGASLLRGQGVGMVAVIAVFLSNIPEGFSSAAGMRKAGRSKAYIFGVWGGIALASGLAALLGNLLLAGTSPTIIAVADAIAAGAILAMLVDTMIPEAFEVTHEYAGLVTVAGFLCAFMLSKLGG
jgi:ZIP family zinc transporter